MSVEYKDTKIGKLPKEYKEGWLNGFKTGSFVLFVLMTLPYIFG